MGDASSELDRLVERWGARAAVVAPPATASRGDALALAEALKAAITLAFDRAVDPEGTKLALALAIVEDARCMSLDRKPAEPPRIFDLVRAMVTVTTAPADVKADRDLLAGRLDELEDLLDGLFVALAPGGAARG